MSEDHLKLIIAKLELLRNFLIVANEGARQQQSAMQDEAIGVLKDIRTLINQWIRENSK